mmetsp:Transcript_20733/g.60301  ORF Transcript_20733/g.60301 Transcript_20733/m.60301 type:complete len:226 (-) Transcript_20733:32-709(-)
MQYPVRLSDFGYCLKVSNRQGRIRRALAEDKLSVRLDGLCDNVRVSEIHEIELHPKGHELFPTDAISPAVGTVGDDAMIARFHECINARGRGRHSCAHTYGTITVLNQRHLLLEHLDSRVVRPTVAVSRVKIFIHRLLYKCRTEVNGGQNGACLFAWGHTPMHELSVERHIRYPGLVQFATEGTGTSGDSAFWQAGCHGTRKHGEGLGFSLSRCRFGGNGNAIKV